MRNDPFNPVLRVRRARAYREAGDYVNALAQYEEALQLAPQLAVARLEYARTLTEKPAAPGAACRVLLLGSASGCGHTNTDAILASPYFSTSTILVEHWDFDRPLPEADVVFNAISDADACGAALDIAAAILERSNPVRVINAPARVRYTGRLTNAVRFAGIDGLIVPRVTTLTRTDLRDSRAYELLAAQGIEPPLLVRSVGTNNGETLALVDRAESLAEQCAALPGNAFFATAFVNTRADDGLIRKYRAIGIGGRLFPLHCARSHAWNVHYTSADTSLEAIAEEERYLRDMEGTLGLRAMAALRTAFERLGLEYAGIDFGIDRDGRVVFYEGNATMTIYVPERFGHESLRRRAAEEIILAARHCVAGS